MVAIAQHMQSPRKTPRINRVFLHCRPGAALSSTSAPSKASMGALEPSQAAARGDADAGEAAEGVELSVTRHGPKSVAVRWSIPWNFTGTKLRQKTTRCLWSAYFEVGGKDCRLLVYPAGAAGPCPCPAHGAPWIRA